LNQGASSDVVFYVKKTYGYKDGQDGQDRKDRIRIFLFFLSCPSCYPAFSPIILKMFFPGTAAGMCFPLDIIV